jgi:glycosyltransferase involved in cell wall biosynthesis
VTTRVLLAVSAVPVAPVRDGYALRVQGLLQGLASRFEVVLVAPAGDPLGLPLLAEHVALPERFDAVARPAPAAWAALRSAGARALARRTPDVALLWPGCELLGTRGLLPVPFVAERIDCQALALWRSLRRGGGERGRLRTLSDLAEVLRYERGVARRAAASILVGEDDARALRRIAGRGVVHVVPNGVHVDPEASATGEGERPTLAFTGVLSFGPNRDAALHLGRAIWPRVRSEVPDAELLIAGREPTSAVRALGDLPGVTVLADVPDLRAVLRRAWLCAAPMRSGSGVKNKVLEAWASARPVVLSPMAANGLGLDADGRRLVAEGDAATAALIVWLLRSPEERRHLGERCRQLAETAHGWAPAARRVGDILEAAAAGTGRCSSTAAALLEPPGGGSLR